MSDATETCQNETSLLMDDVKMVTPRTQKMNLRRPLIAAWDWSQEWDQSG